MDLRNESTFSFPDNLWGGGSIIDHIQILLSTILRGSTIIYDLLTVKASTIFEENVTFLSTITLTGSVHFENEVIIDEDLTVNGVFTANGFSRFFEEFYHSAPDYDFTAIADLVTISGGGGTLIEDEADIELSAPYIEQNTTDWVANIINSFIIDSPIIDIVASTYIELTTTTLSLNGNSKIGMYSRGDLDLDIGGLLDPVAEAKTIRIDNYSGPTWFPGFEEPETAGLIQMQSLCISLRATFPTPNPPPLPGQLALYGNLVSIAGVGTISSTAPIINITGATTITGATSIAGVVSITGATTINGLTQIVGSFIATTGATIYGCYCAVDPTKPTLPAFTSLGPARFDSTINCVGTATFTGVTNCNGDLNVLGVTTFTGIVNSQTINATNIVVSGPVSSSNISVMEGNIASNTSAISTHSGLISSNAAGIASNSAAIGTLVGFQALVTSQISDLIGLGPGISTSGVTIKYSGGAGTVGLTMTCTHNGNLQLGGAGLTTAGDITCEGKLEVGGDVGLHRTLDVTFIWSDTTINLGDKWSGTGYHPLTVLHGGLLAYQNADFDSTVNFRYVVPSCGLAPSSGDHLCNKSYVDSLPGLSESLQDTYENSVSSPQLILDEVGGALVIKANSNVNNILELLDSTSSLKFYVDKNGNAESQNFTCTSFTNGIVLNTEINHLSGVSSGIQGQLDSKANLSGCTFTGLVSFTIDCPQTSVAPIVGDSLVNKTYVDNHPSFLVTLQQAYDNSVGSPKIIVNDTEGPFNIQQDAAGLTMTLLEFRDNLGDLVGYVDSDGDALLGGFTCSSFTNGTISNTELNYLSGVSSNIQGQLDLKAPLASPTFTGTVSGITKAMVGLGNVDNTSDTDKPVSTAQQAALDLKANLASPTFTGTVGGITQSMVGLGNVNNTSDADKPVSTAQQSALNLKADLSGCTFTGDVTIGVPKHIIAPQIATAWNHVPNKLYVDSKFNTPFIANGNSDGAYNLRVGLNAGDSITSGSGNICVGHNAGTGITTESYNTMVGYNAGVNCTGESNCIFGSTAMAAGAASSYNSAFGFHSLQNLTTGDFNTALGIDSGLNTTTGSNNTCIGRNAGTASSALNITTQSNKCVLCNDTTDEYHFSGTSTSLIESQSTTLNLFQTPTNLNIGAAGKTCTIKGSLEVDENLEFSGTFKVNTIQGILATDNIQLYTSTTGTITLGDSNSSVELNGNNATTNSHFLVATTGIGYSWSGSSAYISYEAFETNCDFNHIRNTVAGVILMNGTGAEYSSYPIFYSVPDLLNYFSQDYTSGTTNYTAQSGSAVGAWSKLADSTGLRDKDDRYTVLPGWGLIGYTGLTYTSTESINFKNTTKNPVIVIPNGVNQTVSIKIYFQDVEVTKKT